MWSQTKDGCDAWLSSTLQHFKHGARFLPWDPQFFWHYFYIAEGLARLAKNAVAPRFFGSPPAASSPPLCHLTPPHLRPALPFLTVMATSAAAPAPHLVLPHRDAHAPPSVVQHWSTRRVSGHSPNRSGDGRGTARGRCVARRVGGMLGEAEAGDGAGMEATSCHYCGTAAAAACIECRATGVYSTTPAPRSVPNASPLGPSSAAPLPPSSAPTATSGGTCPRPLRRAAEDGAWWNI